MGKKEGKGVEVMEGGRMIGGVFYLHSGTDIARSDHAHTMGQALLGHQWVQLIRHVAAVRGKWIVFTSVRKCACRISRPDDYVMARDET